MRVVEALGFALAENLEGLDGDAEAEAAFGRRFGDLGEGVGVGEAFDEAGGEVLALLAGEGGEGFLGDLFFHRVGGFGLVVVGVKGS